MNHSAGFGGFGSIPTSSSQLLPMRMSSNHTASSHSLPFCPTSWMEWMSGIVIESDVSSPVVNVGAEVVFR